MKATDFELRHQTPVHLTLVTAAFLTYLVDPDDMVWKLVRGEPHARLLERLLFAVATVLIGTGSWLRTRALVEGGSELSGQPTRREGFSRVLTYPQHLGNLLFSIGLASLAPLWGFVLLAAGETVLVIRLIGREEAIRKQAAGATELPRSVAGQAATAQSLLQPNGLPRGPIGVGESDPARSGQVGAVRDHDCVHAAVTRSSSRGAGSAQLRNVGGVEYWIAAAINGALKACKTKVVLAHIRHFVAGVISSWQNGHLPSESATICPEHPLSG